VDDFFPWTNHFICVDKKVLLFDKFCLQINSSIEQSTNLEPPNKLGVKKLFKDVFSTKR